MAYYYAQLNSNGMVFSVFESTQPLESLGDSFIELDQYKPFLLGHTYADGEFLPPAPPDKILNRIDVITKLGSQYNSIVLASKSDVEVEVWLEKFRLTDSFNASDGSLELFFSTLVDKGVLTADQVSSIVTP